MSNEENAPPGWTFVEAAGTGIKVLNVTGLATAGPAIAARAITPANAIE
jgi:hypothetical protein